MDNTIHVIKAPDDPSKGHVHFHGKIYDCALGKGGVRAQDQKKEGDGATPAGLYSLKALFIRADRIRDISTHLPVTIVKQNMGWCDDVTQDNYNKLISLPFTGSYENLWREDGLYDLLIETSHNSAPTHKEAGSSIFMHIARTGLSPTRGCVALDKDDLIQLLKDVGRDTLLRIYP